MANRGVNKVIIIGNIGNDPEIRVMPNGNPVANFSLATSEAWKDKQTGEEKEKTEWHRIVIFGKLAEIVQKYVKKGSKLYVEGRLQTRKYQDQSGADRYTTEIVANELQMLDGRAGTADASGNSGAHQGASSSPSSQAVPTQPSAMDDFEDDTIPF